MTHRALVVAALLGGLGGCYSTTVRSGLAPGDVPPGYQDRWQSGFWLGAVQSGAPYPLRDLCPQGWAELRVVTNPVQGLLSWLTYGIYTPQSVTVVCAAGRPPAPPPRAGAPPLAPPPARVYPPSQTSGQPPPPPRPYDF